MCMKIKFYKMVLFGVILKIRDLEKGTDVSDVIEMKDYKETLSRTRDVIKKTAYGG